jgi:hypothetical protein
MSDTKYRFITLSCNITQTVDDLNALFPSSSYYYQLIILDSNKIARPTFAFPGSSHGLCCIENPAAQTALHPGIL